MNKEALEERFEKNEKLVYRVFNDLPRIGGYDSADDIIQCGRLGLVRAIERFNASNGAAFSTYAYSCIRNAMLSELKRQKRWRKNNIAIAPEAIPSYDRPSEGLIETVERIKESAPSMYAKGIEALILRAHGVPYDSIARTIGMPIATTRTYASKAAAYLRRHPALREYDPRPPDLKHISLPQQELICFRSKNGRNFMSSFFEDFSAHITLKMFNFMYFSMLNSFDFHIFGQEKTCGNAPYSSVFIFASNSAMGREKFF